MALGDAAFARLGTIKSTPSINRSRVTQKETGNVGRLRLAVREGTVQALLLFVLGLFLYLINSDRIALPMLAQGMGLEIFQECLGKGGGKMS